MTVERFHQVLAFLRNARLVSSACVCCSESDAAWAWLTGSCESEPSVPPENVLSLPGDESEACCCSDCAWLRVLVATCACASARRW